MSHPNSDAAAYPSNEPRHQPSADQQYWSSSSQSGRPEFAQDRAGNQERSGNQQWQPSPLGRDEQQQWNSSPSWQDSASQPSRTQDGSYRQQGQYQQQSQYQGQSWDQPSGQPPYPNYPNQYGGQYAGPQGDGPRRPALVTTAAILGFIFSPFGFISGVIALFTMTALSGRLTFTNSNVMLGWQWTVCTLVSGLVLFIGSVQAISGRSPHLSAAACVIFLVGQLAVPLSAHIAGGGGDDMPMVISWSWAYFLVCALLAGLQLFLLYLPEARRWFAAKKQEFAR